MGGATWLGPVELDLESLRSFITVAAEGSMARAAPLLFVSTSGLSRRIHELERKLGVELLERSMHGVVLTPAGEQILLHAKKILEACDELFATAREAVAGPGWRRVVHMGIAPGVENSTRNRVIGAVTAADADAVVALDPDANVHLIRKLIVGELELAILHQRPLSPEVRSFQLGSKRTLVCLARHLPQASHETLSLGDLTSLPFVTSRRSRRDAGLLRSAPVDLRSRRQPVVDVAPPLRCSSISQVAPDSESHSIAINPHGTMLSSVPWWTSSCTSAPGSRGAGRPRMTPPCWPRWRGCARSTPPRSPRITAARCWRPADDHAPAPAMDNRAMPDVFKFPVPSGVGAVALAAGPAR